MAELTISKIIAVIDDDENVRVAIRGLVRSLGLEACCFASGQQFLASEERAATACLVVDVQMPDLNGLDLQARLAAEGEALPIIFITAFPDERIEARARALGALGFLSKPFESEALVQCIQQALASRGLD
jgi:FixJ family two-component response regulator